MITFNIQEKQFKQLKKFISGWDTTNEQLYLHTDSRNNLYLVLFDVNHIYINYLKLGVTDEFTDKHLGFCDNNRTYEINSTYTKGGADDPKQLKKFISKQKNLNIKADYTQLEWFNDDGEYFISYKAPCDLNLDLIFLANRTEKEFHLQKQDLKVLELYKGYPSCIYFKKGRIEFKIYNDEYKVFAKHIICDNYNNELEEHIHISNSILYQVLRKFNSKETITLKFEDREPLTIESEDFTGIIAPRIIFDEAYGSVDGIFDELGDD